MNRRDFACAGLGVAVGAAGCSTALTQVGAAGKPPGNGDFKYAHFVGAKLHGGAVGTSIDIALSPNDEGYWSVGGDYGAVDVDLNLLKTQSILRVTIVQAGADATMILAGKGGESSVVGVRN